MIYQFVWFMILISSIFGCIRPPSDESFYSEYETLDPVCCNTEEQVQSVVAQAAVAGQQQPTIILLRTYDEQAFTQTQAPPPLAAPVKRQRILYVIRRPAQPEVLTQPQVLPQPQPLPPQGRLTSLPINQLPLPPPPPPPVSLPPLPTPPPPPVVSTTNAIVPPHTHQPQIAPRPEIIIITQSSSSESSEEKTAPSRTFVSRPPVRQIGDAHSKCCFWASKGECETNSFWMKPNCKESCGSYTCTIKNASLCPSRVSPRCQGKRIVPGQPQSYRPVSSRPPPSPFSPYKRKTIV